MGKFERSWCIFKKSVNVLNAHSKLLVFPAISFIAVFLLILLVAGGVSAALGGMPGGTVVLRDENPDGSMNWAWTGAWFLVYLLAMLVANLCSLAFYSEIFRGLDGEKVSILRGFRYAAFRFVAVFFWSLLASTVGVLLRVIQPRMGGFGVFLLRGAGLIWAVASCFAIPAIVFDPLLTNPFAALKRSGEAIRRTWGEALIGFAGLQILVWIALLFWGLLASGMVVLAVALPVAQFAATAISIAAFAVFFAFAYMVFTAEKIYLAALYRYAEGKPLEVFEEQEFREAFEQKGA